MVSLSNHEPSLLQLDEHAVRRCGVDERDQRTFGAGARLLVDELRAAGLELRECRVDVFHAQRDVVESWAALLDIFRNRRVGRRRFEQLQLRFPTGTKCARTRCDVTSSGASISSPSASR